MTCLRKLQGRTLLLVLMGGTSLLMVLVYQTDLSSPFQPYPTLHFPPPYASRRIHDYQSPEYTAPGETATSIGVYQPDRSHNDSEEKVGPKGETSLEEASLGTGREKEPDSGVKPELNPEPKGDAGLEENGPTEVLLPSTEEEKIMAILRKQREILAKAVEGYKIHPKLKAKTMDDLIMERGGNPVRSLVVTSWRSGSTFIGDILHSHPATYYHYEPLLDFGISQIRHGRDALQAIYNLRQLLTCNYTDMEHYLNYGPLHPWLFSHNKQLWNYCTVFPEICWKPEFLTPFCKLFPFLSVKTVRLRLNLTRELLEDKKMGVQVLLLVRDPRGTMQSRHHRNWCPENPDCDDPSRLCSDLVSDYNTAFLFRRIFPHSFRVIRYEDFSFHAYNMTKELFDFFHLNYHPRVQEFLDTHTKEKIGGVSSTFRNSKTAPIHWKQDLSWEEVQSIQKVCNKALKLWGYETAKDENHLRSFMPVGKLNIV